MAATVLDGVEGLRGAVGSHLGYSEWLEVSQERVDQFAEATGDHQWIHVDPVRAAAESPFGGTIAHGYLTLSLTNFFLPQIVEVTGFGMGINYGCGKIRFPTPVPVGARIRAGAQLTQVEDVRDGLQTTMLITVEVEGSDRPACVVDAMSRFLQPTD